MTPQSTSANTAANASVDNGAGEKLRAELLELVREYTPPSFAEQRDMLEGRYRIHINQPLPEYHGELAKAYNVTDEGSIDRPLFAMVCAPDMPMRPKLARILKGLAHPNLVALVAYGIVELSPEGQQRFVMVYERPKGKKLSQVIAEHSKQLSDIFIIEHILSPLVSALHCYEEAGLPHGRINPDNIWFGDKIVLGESASEPCGWSQDWRFEPSGRLQALLPGKGEGFQGQDYYALGVLAAWLKFGPGIFVETHPHAYLKRLLREGSYHALVGNREASDQLYDLLRGTLNDNHFERWRYPQVKAWTGGKRYNLLAPTVPGTGSRAFVFQGTEYSNFKSLGDGLYQHWESASEVLRDGTLARWAEMSVRRKDTAEALNRAVKSLGGEYGRSEKQNSELTARCLSIIDPAAPMRMKEVRVYADGYGTLLADCYRRGDNQSMQHLCDIVEQGLVSIWGDLQRRDAEDSIPQELGAVIWNIDRIRLMFRNPGFGFGVERVMYELSPDLPCLSPLVSGYYVTTLPQLLMALDAQAHKRARTDDPLDRHIAAFISAKLGLTQEITCKEFKHIPALVKHKGLISLRMLQMAQKKAGDLKLPGLSAWVTASVATATEHLHSRTLIKQISKALSQMALGGNLTPISNMIFHQDYIAADAQGFEGARHRYRQLNASISGLMNEDARNDNAYAMGNNMARITAYIIFLCTMMFVVQGKL